MFVRTLFCALVASCFAAAAARAERIDIQITGLDFNFSSGEIFDAASVIGGNRDPNEADPVQTIDFFKGDDWVGALNENIFADLLVEDVPNLLTTGDQKFTGTFHLDLLQGGSPATRLLGLTFCLMEVDLNVSASGKKSVFLSGDANLVAQNLPAEFGLKFDDDDTISVSIGSSFLRNPTFTGDNQYLTGFTTKGTSDLTGSSGDGSVPEPATWTLLSIGALAGLGMLRLRKRG